MRLLIHSFLILTSLTYRAYAHTEGKKEPLLEVERSAEYRKRNYSWPIARERFVPQNEGWINLMQKRFEQIEDMVDVNHRYMAYHQAVISAILAPTFSEFGFAVARAPHSLLRRLQQGIHQGLLRNQTYPEPNVHVILGQKPPRMIFRPDLVNLVLSEMQPFTEAWAQMELTPHKAYGFRLYSEGNQLMMHTDRSQTHVISFILHIDSSDDAEPWPLLIEDFYGNTHEVILTPGDVLFYESSKCNHGRPYPFKGSWYTSVFVHYYPRHGWEEIDHDMEGHFAIPAHWNVDPKGEPRHDRMVSEGMSFREPDCPHDWCALQHSIKWSGPGEDGYLLLPNQEKIPFDPFSVDNARVHGNHALDSLSEEL
jgi:hypothetical protein